MNRFAAPPMLLCAALALSACQPAADPQAAAAAKAQADERAAQDMARQFDEQVAKQDWSLARAHGAVLLGKYPDSAAARRIKAQYQQIQARADADREQRRLASLWSYQTEPAKGGAQLSAAIYARDNVDTGAGPKPVRLIFRDHPEWGRSSYLTLEAGDFDCYGGCRLKVKVDDAAARTMAGSRPKTDEAIAMFVEDERALWKLAKDARTLSIEFPVKAGGTRTAVFEVEALDSARLPAWN